MSYATAQIDFRKNTQRVPPTMPVSVQKATTRFLGGRATLVDILGRDLWQELRQAGHDLRLHAITHLDHYLEEAERAVTKSGGHVHWARDATEACRLILEVAREHHVERVVKSKSMVTEEIGLNHAMEAAGIRVLETDLGEYIVQLAGVGPAHIVAPAFHLSKEEIAALFRAKLGVEAPAEAGLLCQIARQALREEFLAADMGISGGNFLVAETGTIVMVTNEGNGRMCTTVPPLHVAVVAIDKIVPDWECLTVLLKLLARSATGQKITCYTSLISGPPRTATEGGPREFHLVLLDNGRSRILQSPACRETLLCIRCGACLNICPVYNSVGGYAYGWPISGPTGAMLAPQILGTVVAGALPFASTLCGACNEICPVKIPITEILLHLRHRVVEGEGREGPVAPAMTRAGAKVGAVALGTPWLYRLGSRLVKLVQAPWRRDGWLSGLPPPLNRWTRARQFPAFAAEFRQWWRSRGGGKGYEFRTGRDSGEGPPLARP